MDRRGRRAKESTRYGYCSTLDHAKGAFGHKRVRDLRIGDVTSLLNELDRGGLSPSTQAKHLRVLGACLEGAVRHGISARNPARELGKDERPRQVNQEAGFFEPEEVSRLLGELQAGQSITAVAVTLLSGLRQGELIALRWGRVDRAAGLIHVRSTFTEKGSEPETPPKGNENRDVVISAQANDSLDQWWKYSGRRGNAELVFARPGGGYVPPGSLSRSVLYPAMERANIARVDVKGRKRTWHSTRHTYAARCLEAGAPLEWVSKQLGHADATITARVYAHVSQKAKPSVLEQLESAGALSL